MKTSDSGYLTRKLVDAAQQRRSSARRIAALHDGVRQTGTDLAAAEGSVASAERACETIRQPTDRQGRSSRAGRADLGPRQAKALQEGGRRGAGGAHADEVQGGARACAGGGYGMEPVDGGGLWEAGLWRWGVLAAQSIGEPATQLTMRTFHSGGSGRRLGHHAELGRG